MNNAQKKILEAVGIVSNNRLKFSKFSHENIFNIKDFKEINKAPSLVCAKSERCLIMTNSWFRESGMYLSWGSLGGFFLISICFFAMVYSGLYNGFFDIGGILLAIGIFIIAFLASYPLLFAAKSELKLQGLQYTIFNTDSKNVHFVSDVDFQPKTCCWEECTFCLAYSAGSIEGYYYELKGYLFNEDGSVRDSFSFDDYHYMISNSDNTRQAMIKDLSARFEYVRRFMEEGADSVEHIAGSLDLKPSLSEAAHRFQPRSKASEGKKFHVIYSIVRTMFLIPFSVQVVGHYFFCRYCRLPQWPQSVIDECGEDIFPKR